MKVRVTREEIMTVLFEAGWCGAQKCGNGGHHFHKEQAELILEAVPTEGEKGCCGKCQGAHFTCLTNLFFCHSPKHK